MYEILKAFAIVKEWEFDYGLADFNNLFNGEEKINTPYLFLDPVQISDSDNDSGVCEKKIHAGHFTLLYSSDIDEVSYDERFQKYIKPIIDGAITEIKENIVCNYDAKIDNWKITEVINIFDYNFDGIICDFQVTIDE